LDLIFQQPQKEGFSEESPFFLLTLFEKQRKNAFLLWKICVF